MKTLETPVPVKDMVAKAYKDGLEARGMLAPRKAKYGMKVDVSQFDCNQYARREAHIRFDISLTELQTGESVYDTVVTVDRVTGNVITLDAGIFASVEDLRKLANEALQEAVDKTLDDPKLREKVV